MGGLLNGKFFFPQSVPYFLSDQVNINHKILTQFHRLVGSQGIKSSFKYILEMINNSFIKQTGKCKFSYDIFHENFTLISESNIYQYQSSFDNILLELSPYNQKFQEKIPLIFTTHYDSYDIGPSTYDGSIIIAVLLEIARIIYSSIEDIRRPIFFAFLGSGKWGSHGSISLCNELQKKEINKAYLLTLDSIGVGRPFSLIGHSTHSYNILRAWSKTSNSISSTFINDLFSILNSQSYSDSKIYEENGYYWSQSIFMGNPAIYYTSFDDIHNINDIKYLGQQLFGFWKNLNDQFENHEMLDDIESDAIAFGINPFSICVKKSTLKKLSISTILISFTIIFYHFYNLYQNHQHSLNISFFENDHFNSIFKALFIYIQSFAICSIISILVNKINPLSFMDHQYACFIALITIVSLASIIFNLTSILRSNSPGFILVHLIHHILLLYFTINTDFSIYYFLCVIIQTVHFMLYSLISSQYFTNTPFNHKKLPSIFNRIYHFISILLTIFQVFLVSFTYNSIHSTLFGITANVSKPLGNFVLIISCYFALEMIIPILIISFSIFPSQDPFDKDNFYQTMKKDGQDEDEKPKPRDRLVKRAERIEAEEERLKCYYQEIKQKKLEKYGLYISIVFFVLFTFSFFGYLIIKDHPFSHNYPLKGSILHVYDGKEESQISFMPVFRSPIPPIIKKAMTNAIVGQQNISYISNYRGFLNNNDVLLQRFKGKNQRMPPFIRKWPSFSISTKNITNDNKPYLNRRRITFHGNDIPSEIHQGIFIFKCKLGQNCVKKLSIMNNSHKIVHHNNQVIIREIPLEKNFSLEVDVQGPPLSTQVLFVSSKHSKEFDYFRYNLNDYIQNYATENTIINTVLKNNTII